MHFMSNILVAPSYHEIKSHENNWLVVLIRVMNLIVMNLNGHGYSASFSCLRLFPHLLVKIQNSFLCMC